MDKNSFYTLLTWVTSILSMSVGRSVRPSVGPSVRPSVRSSVRRSVHYAFFRRAVTRRRTTYFVYTNLFSYILVSSLYLLFMSMIPFITNFMHFWILHTHQYSKVQMLTFSWFFLFGRKKTIKFISVTHFLAENFFHGLGL